MAERNQVRCLLRGADAGDTGDLEWVAFGIIRQVAEHIGFDAHEGMSARGAFGFGLRGYVHHAGGSGGVEVGEFTHWGKDCLATDAHRWTKRNSSWLQDLDRVAGGPGFAVGIGD